MPVDPTFWRLRYEDGCLRLYRETQPHKQKFLFLIVLGIKPGALHMVDKHSTTEIHPNPRRVLRFYFLFYMCEHFACMCLSVPHVYSAHGGQNWALNPLELKLQMTVS